MLAAERAVDLGADLLRRGRTHLGSLIPKGERDYATAVDLEIETTIKGVLAEAAPEIPFLGEEEGGARVEAPRLWVLDPIDGTVNFSKGSPLCGISLALVEAGHPSFGIVDLPLLGERYVAAAGAGAFLNGRRMAVSDTGDLKQAVIGFADFAVGSHADAENRIHRELMRRLARESLRVRVHGSACLDLAWLAAGRLSATVMLSNLPWDVAAGALLVREAGGEAYDHDGSAYSSRSLFTLASVPGIAADLLRIVEESIEAVASTWPDQMTSRIRT
jgi:Archaeal fructose-1,6-bisphosphatase and related enzymes of inositol monophosphatase family